MSIVTLGIYALFWYAQVNNDINRVVGDYESPSGGTVIVLSIITCGIYFFYWSYKLGEKVDYIKGTPNGSSNIIYLLLCLFGGGIINVALTQDTLNRIAPY